MLMLNGRVTSRFGDSWPLPLTIAALALFAPAVFAAPCEVAPLTTYEAAGFTCTIDGYTLSDLTFTSSSTGGAPVAPDSDITVNPFIDSSGYVIQFESDDFVNDTSGTAEYIAQYELDPVFPRINGIDMDLGPADPPNLIGQFCGNGTFTGPFDPSNPTTVGCEGTDPSGIFPLALGPLDTNNSDVSGDFPIPVTDVDNRLILQLEGPSSAQWFEEGISLTTPEPSMLALLIPGLVGLLLLGKRLAER
jgi:hypothetical protein